MNNPLVVGIALGLLIGLVFVLAYAMTAALVPAFGAAGLVFVGSAIGVVATLAGFYFQSKI